MPAAIPNYDLGLLITLDISLAILGLLMTFIGIWTILRQGLRSQEIMLEVTRISQRIDARLRRDFPDIGGDIGD